MTAQERLGILTLRAASLTSIRRSRSEESSRLERNGGRNGTVDARFESAVSRLEKVVADLEKTVA